jgi:hypothetical protein
VAHKAAAIALAFVSILFAIVAYSALKPDPETLTACVHAGGSGSTCDAGGPWVVGVPALIVFFGVGGALAVWRGR